MKQIYALFSRQRSRAGPAPSPRSLGQSGLCFSTQYSTLLLTAGDQGFLACVLTPGCHRVLWFLCHHVLVQQLGQLRLHLWSGGSGFRGLPFFPTKHPSCDPRAAQDSPALWRLRLGWSGTRLHARGRAQGPVAGDPTVCPLWLFRGHHHLRRPLRSHCGAGQRGHISPLCGVPSLAS